MTLRRKYYERKSEFVSLKKVMKKLLCAVLSIILVFSAASVAFAADITDLFKPFENSEFFFAGDYTLHYRTYGSDTAEKQVMLLHGFGLSTASFEGLAEEYVKKGFRVVTVDLPNFGYSSRETARTNLVEREELVSALIDELGGSWVLGGHSMGGGVAANVAIERQDKVTGLVLFAPQTSQTQSPFVAAIMKSPAVRTVFDVIIKVGTQADFLMRMLVEMSFSDKEYANNYDVSRISAPLQIDGTGAGMAVMTSHAQGTNIEKFGELKIPMVIVTTTNDQVADADNLNALINSGAENLKVVTFEEGGHMYMEYAPESACEATYQTILAA